METKALEAFIRRYATFTDDEMTAVLANFRFREVRKGAVILQHGQVAHEFCYVEKGAFRMVDPNREPEVTVWAVFDDSYLCQLASFFPQTPSRLLVEATEDSAIWAMTHAEMERLYRTLPGWQEFGRQLWQDTLIQFIDVAFSLQNHPAQVRYQKFSADRRMTQRLSLKHLASILGITPFTLSRLRGRK